MAAIDGIQRWQWLEKELQLLHRRRGGAVEVWWQQWPRFGSISAWWHGEATCEAATQSFVAAWMEVFTAM